MSLFSLPGDVFVMIASQLPPYDVYRLVFHVVSGPSIKSLQEKVMCSMEPFCTLMTLRKGDQSVREWAKAVASLEMFCGTFIDRQKGDDLDRVDGSDYTLFANLSSNGLFLSLHDRRFMLYVGHDWRYEVGAPLRMFLKLNQLRWSWNECAICLRKECYDEPLQQSRCDLPSSLILGPYFDTFFVSIALFRGVAVPCLRRSVFQKARTVIRLPVDNGMPPVEMWREFHIPEIDAFKW